MKDTVRMLRVERKKLGHECIRFMRQFGANNVYLYEGIEQSHSLFRNYCLLHGERIIGTIHAKNSIHLHLFLLPAMGRSTAERVCTLIERRFPGLEMLFGDEKSIFLFIRSSRHKPKRIIRFRLMETDRSRFRPALKYRGMSPSIDTAPLLVPLQIQYEIEEIGANYAQISKQRVRRVLERKIERDEITAIFRDGVPVALAGVNARFENTCQIGSVYVMPKYRGKGYGMSVISSHIERLFNHYDHIVLFVEEGNYAAQHIYEKVGFMQTGKLLQAYYL